MPRRDRPAREPTVSVSVSSVTDPAAAPAGAENRFVLVDAPAGEAGVDRRAEEERVLARIVRPA